MERTFCDFSFLRTCFVVIALLVSHVTADKCEVTHHDNRTLNREAVEVRELGIISMPLENGSVGCYQACCDYENEDCNIALFDSTILSGDECHLIKCEPIDQCLGEATDGMMLFLISHLPHHPDQATKALGFTGTTSLIDVKPTAANNENHTNISRQNDGDTIQPPAQAISDNTPGENVEHNTINNITPKYEGESTDEPASSPAAQYTEPTTLTQESFTNTSPTTALQQDVNSASQTDVTPGYNIGKTAATGVTQTHDDIIVPTIVVEESPTNSASSNSPQDDINTSPPITGEGITNPITPYVTLAQEGITNNAQTTTQEIIAPSLAESASKEKSMNNQTGQSYTTSSILRNHSDSIKNGSENNTISVPSSEKTETVTSMSFIGNISTAPGSTNVDTFDENGNEIVAAPNSEDTKTEQYFENVTGNGLEDESASSGEISQSNAEEEANGSGEVNEEIFNETGDSTTNGVLNIVESDNVTQDGSTEDRVVQLESTVNTSTSSDADVETQIHANTLAYTQSPISDTSLSIDYLNAVLNSLNSTSLPKNGTSTHDGLVDHILNDSPIDAKSNLSHAAPKISTMNETSLDQSDLNSEYMLSGALISVLTFGLVFFVVVMSFVGKKVYDGWTRRHYSRVDYLVNGMYN